MFLSDILNEKKESTPVFTKEPIISRLSHSFNDAHWSYPYHVHKQETELIYFSQGKASYQINNEIFHVSEGDLLIVNKGCIHSITSDYEDPISCWTCAILQWQMQKLRTVSYHWIKSRMHMPENIKKSLRISLKHWKCFRNRKHSPLRQFVTLWQTLWHIFTFISFKMQLRTGRKRSQHLLRISYSI